MIETALMYLFVAVASVAALAMLIARHPMRVALALITAMLALAGIYALLGVHVIAVFQVLIYVGAVMVFMVYVIMLLDIRDSSFGRRFSRFVVPALIGAGALVAVLGYVLWNALAAPPIAPTTEGTFGVQSFSIAFLNEYWLQFELVSVLLVAAVVAAIAVVQLSRRHRG